MQTRQWFKVVKKMIVTDPVGFAAKLVRLTMLVGGACTIVANKCGYGFVLVESDVQIVVGSLITAVALIWSFKNSAELQQERPLK